MTIVEAEQDAVLAPCTRLCWGQLIGGIVAGRYLYKDVIFTCTCIINEVLRFLHQNHNYGLSQNLATLSSTIVRGFLSYMGSSVGCRKGTTWDFVFCCICNSVYGVAIQ